MRVCIVNPFFHPYKGGIEERIKAIGKRLSNNHEIHIVTSQLPGTKPFEVIDGIRVHRLPSRYFQIYNPPLIFTSGIKKKIQELKPDLIHLHYRWAWEYTKAVASFLYDIPVVITWHNEVGEGEMWQRPFSFLNDNIFKHYIAKKSDKIICISNYLKRQLISHGMPDEMLETVYNGVESQERSRQEDDFIVYIGRLVQSKGLDILAKAMENVNEKLMVSGNGPGSRYFKNTENVEMLGVVSRDKKNELLKKCKFLVLPSKAESFGIVLLEAMVFGKPVVASNVGGIPEVVGGGGILVPPNDPLELSAAINKLLKDNKLRFELGKKAQEQAKTFSWDKTASQIEDVYKEVSDK